MVTGVGGLVTGTGGLVTGTLELELEAAAAEEAESELSIPETEETMELDIMWLSAAAPETATRAATVATA